LYLTYKINKNRQDIGYIFMEIKQPSQQVYDVFFLKVSYLVILYEKTHKSNMLRATSRLSDDKQSNACFFPLLLTIISGAF
jgi:hypothetical protein